MCYTKLKICGGSKMVIQVQGGKTNHIKFSTVKDELAINFENEWGKCQDTLAFRYHW